MSQRSCHNCRLSGICKAYAGLIESMKGMSFNIDGDAAPGKMHQVADALGNCCTKFEEYPTEIID